MRRGLIVFGLFLILPAGMAFAQTFGAVLTASQEVPPTSTTGFGNATVSFTDSTHSSIAVKITVANLGSPINNFHIHEAAAGVAGSVIINLIGLGGTFTNNTMSGTFPVPADVAARILAHPENFYVNVHTTQFPGGAIRGQLAAVSGTVIHYSADLRSANEVPPSGTSSFGSAFLTINTVNKTLQYEVTTTGIASPTLSHIHGPNGAAGTNAGVLIGLATSPAQIPNGRTKGSIDISSLSAENFNAILTTPQNFYVNVHSSAFPGGEVRGQLTPANELDLPVAGRVGSFVTDVRVFNPSFADTANALLEYFPASLAANTNATNTMVVSIPPRSMAILNDVTGSANLGATDGIGAVRISSASAINATSRIFSDQRPSGKGTFGQFLPGLSPSAALRRGVLPQLANNSDSRTNVGFFNPNSATVTARLDLRNGNGVVVASSLQTFQALSQQQNSIGTYFPGVDLSDQGNLSLSFDASAPIDVYAAVNDNVSTDSFVVVAQEDSGVNTNP